MTLTRRFMNLIVETRLPGVKSLSCVDLRSLLFGDAAPPEPRIGEKSESTILQGNTTQTLTADAINQKDKLVKAADLKMEMIQLPSPIFTLQASPSALNQPCRIDCFPLTDGRLMWTDQSGRSFLVQTETGYVEVMPTLHKPKYKPFSLFVPNAEGDKEFERDGSTLFVMEKIPEPEAIGGMQQSYQFEAIVYSFPKMNVFTKMWDSRLLPPPPFVREPRYWPIRPEINSYAVVGGGKHICISVDGVGSYCLSTETHTWSELGKWSLPFHGKAEYVPELKLWLGFSAAKDRQLVAADLSVMDSQPYLVRTSKQLDLPEEWEEYRDPELVNLGSGRFCIVRYFQTRRLYCNSGDYSGQIFAVFTGVEVLRPDCGDNGNTSNSGKGVDLLMIPHKSICHMSNGTSIDVLF